MIGTLTDKAYFRKVQKVHGDMASKKLPPDSWGPSKGSSPRCRSPTGRSRTRRRPTPTSRSGARCFPEPSTELVSVAVHPSERYFRYKAQFLITYELFLSKPNHFCSWTFYLNKSVGMVLMIRAAILRCQDRGLLQAIKQSDKKYLFSLSLDIKLVF